MATVDVESLYSNIVNYEGLESMRYYLKSRSKDALPPSDFIVHLTEWTLENIFFCLFLFEDYLYREEKGTAMGANFGPNYANVFFGLWE